eukprot:3743689-Rhodomonas_salina.3
MRDHDSELTVLIREKPEQPSSVSSCLGGPLAGPGSAGTDPDHHHHDHGDGSTCRALKTGLPACVLDRDAH